MTYAGECMEHNIQWFDETNDCPVCVATAALAAAEAERDVLFQVAVLAFQTIDEAAFATMKPGMKELDHYVANEIEDDLYGRICEAVRKHKEQK